MVTTLDTEFRTMVMESVSELPADADRRCDCLVGGSTVPSHSLTRCKRRANYLDGIHPICGYHLSRRLRRLGAGQGSWVGNTDERAR